MEISVSSLCAILQRPELADRLQSREWSGLIALARRANLLGTLGERLGNAGISAGCNADRHLLGARRLSERQRRSVRWETQSIHDALAELAIPVVLLKGAAYVMGCQENARGRLFGDIDILVASESLGDVEIRLMINGWAPAVSAEYDERYYRKWMHELPPMAHVRRGTVIDVHHTVLPPTARLTPDPTRIFARAIPLPDFPGFRVPCPEDLIVHSIVHLVHEGDVDNGLRDLYDIWMLLERAAIDPGFGTRLHTCCQDHGVTAPVTMGLRLLSRFFAVSAPAMRLIPRQSAGPLFGYGSMSEWLFYRAIRALDKEGALVSVLRLAIYIRAHWLRMPPLLLARHLGKKLSLRLLAKADPSSGDNPL